MPTTYRYVFNIKLTMPAHGKYSAGGRGAWNGETTSPFPLTEQQMQEQLIADIAQKVGFEPSDAVVEQFAYSDLTA